MEPSSSFSNRPAVASTIAWDILRSVAISHVSEAELTISDGLPGQFE
jgi:hypothetical protein